MIWRVDVATKEGLVDPTSRGAQAGLAEFGFPGIRSVRAFQVYLLDGDLDRAAADRVARELLHDPVSQDYTLVEGATPPPAPASTQTILVFKRPGVMDPVEASALKAVGDLGLTVRRIRTGMRYVVAGGADGSLRDAAAKVLGNEAIEEVTLGDRAFTRIELGAPYAFKKTVVPILKLDDAALLKLSKDMTLSLNLKELHAIRDYFKGIGRDPSDIELESIAQTWSEHCKHKTFTGHITFEGKVIPNLLKSTIAQATKDLNKSWCVSVFKDNAGIIEFDETSNVCFKVETHNHPSAIEPYGGANTGLGGVIRDILGCGLGAKPVCSTDVFCVGQPDAKEIPPGTIHPRRLLKGVMSGVRDYGNRMGIPTVNGAVFFDERYTGNPLVFCGTVGILPKAMSFKAAQRGDLAVVVGGRTGRDGIHGATFSSVELHEGSETVSSGAVQIGNAIVEKRVLDTVLQARDRGLYTGITDCGAGGLSSAVGEMGEELGAEVDLEKVPLKYDGLSYTEIWISEAQERMVISVPPDKLQECLAVFKAEDVEATVIGRFPGDGKLKLNYNGQLVGELDMEFLHDGLPRFERTATYTAPTVKPLDPAAKPDYGDDVKKILASGNVCSKEWIIRQYDHEVQGGSVVKPLTGAANDGPSDAAVVRPVLSHYKGLAIGNGMNPRYSDYSPYDMAANAIDEAIRNVVAVGGDPERTAILDNFAWGSPENPEHLGALVLAARACQEVAVAYGTPFISGKDSFNNEFRVGDKRIVIPHSLLISAISIVDDVRKCVTMDAKQAGNAVYIVGITRNDFGGSHYALVNGLSGGTAPRVDVAAGRHVFKAMSTAIRDGLVRSCHDLSEGGLAIAAAEMAFAGGLGLKLDATHSAPEDLPAVVALFSESPSRFLVEVTPANQKAFEGLMEKDPVFAARLGTVVAEKKLTVTMRDQRVLDETLDALKDAWQKPLKW
ncbi:MAG TPA: phosphoribosylformylglycinamidine synthase subunit PurL [Planctomycetota bacterium]|nr:phosphoribosylformylglycinamidine synthase subunit PurL [Planctomycetota bacterium]